MNVHIYPNYYEKFTCIADKCRHNCCIGWEIDIDSKTHEFYKSLTDEFSKRFDSNICDENTPHFVLTENERCPFLNNNNLCDIIIEYGDEHICDICKEHPRFHNELPKRTESGLGLCCEEAARIILSQKDKTTLVCTEKITTDDEIIMLRDDIMQALQNRDQSINARLDTALTLCDTTFTNRSETLWCNVLLSLEQLDKSWGVLLKDAKDIIKITDLEAFDTYMQHRTHEYEQFIVYLLYRHFANAPDLQSAQSRMRFVAFAYYIIRSLGAVIFTQKGEFTFEDQVELIRLFSSEIEYSDENLYTLFDTV